MAEYVFNTSLILSFKSVKRLSNLGIVDYFLLDGDSDGFVRLKRDLGNKWLYFLVKNKKMRY